MSLTAFLEKCRTITEAAKQFPALDNWLAERGIRPAVADGAGLRFLGSEFPAARQATTVDVSAFAPYFEARAGVLLIPYAVGGEVTAIKALPFGRASAPKGSPQASVPAFASVGYIEAPFLAGSLASRGERPVVLTWGETDALAILSETSEYCVLGLPGFWSSREDWASHFEGCDVTVLPRYQAAGKYGDEKNAKIASTVETMRAELEAVDGVRLRVIDLQPGQSALEALRRGDEATVNGPSGDGDVPF